MTTAGWHRDPSGKHELRYHDGHAWTEHVSNHRASPEERKAALDRKIADFAEYGWRVAVRESDFEAVIARGHRPNHLLHLILSLLTLGVWMLLVWLPLTIFGGVKHKRLVAHEDGKVREP